MQNEVDTFSPGRIVRSPSDLVTTVIPEIFRYAMLEDSE